MTHPSSSTTTVVAILGASSIVENILAHLLEEEGYSVRHHEVDPAGLVEGALEGVDILLLAPGLKDGVREGFQEAIKSTPGTATLPMLPLSSALRLSLLDELAVSASWRTLFEELVGQIGDALKRAASSAGALVVEGAEPPPPAPPPPPPPAPAPQAADAAL
jgi:hypothetical protein